MLSIWLCCAAKPPRGSQLSHACFQVNDSCPLLHCPYALHPHVPVLYNPHVPTLYNPHVPILNRPHCLGRSMITLLTGLLRTAWVPPSPSGLLCKCARCLSFAQLGVTPGYDYVAAWDIVLGACTSYVSPHSLFPTAQSEV